jgi:predicted lipoprotein
MKRITLFKIVFGLAVLVLFVLIGRYGFTVVKIEDVDKAIQSQAFDQVTYVDGIWSSKILPAFNEKAVELPKILSEMQPEPDGTTTIDSLTAIANKYGLITVGKAHVYMVKGSGRIAIVDTATSLGTVEVALDGYSGPIKVLLYIGTRIPSDETSVRDAVGFINFGDFTEQTEYGKVGSEINKRVLTQVLEPVDRNSLMGKTISFKGAFNIRTQNMLQIKLNEIRIVPVEIKLGE